MAEASKYIQSNENVCLFCGETVERGLVKDYKGITVWICSDCISEGELGSLMATAILDEPQIDKLRVSPHCRSEALGDIERCVVTTQANFYKRLLYYTFHQVPIKETKGTHRQELAAVKEPEQESSESSEEGLPDESEVLDFLDYWKPIEEIEQHFNTDRKPLLEVLNKLFLRGYILKRGSPQNPEYCNSLIT